VFTVAGALQRNPVWIPEIAAPDATPVVSRPIGD
jgi:hypothetical protein